MIAVDAAFLVGLALVLGAVGVYSALVLRVVLQDHSSFASLLPARRGRVDGLGRAAFLAHRLSGFAILAFLALHVLDVGLDSVAPRLYDDVQRLYGSAPLRVLECGLLFAILFHTCNGLRLLAFDVFRLSPRWSQRLLVGATAATLVAGVAGSALILRPVVP